MIRLRNPRVRSLVGSTKMRSGGPSSWTTPLSRKQTLEGTSLAKPISWVAIRMVVPSRTLTPSRRQQFGYHSRRPTDEHLRVLGGGTVDRFDVHLVILMD